MRSHSSYWTGNEIPQLMLNWESDSDLVAATDQTDIELSYQDTEDSQQTNGEGKGRLVRRHEGASVGCVSVSVLAGGREQLDNEGADPFC